MPAKGHIVSPATDRFSRKTHPEPLSGCWIWGGAVDNSFGYGKFRLHGMSMNAHRAAWILYKGGIPDLFHVLHKCDNPACVNPEHLFLGTQDDNNKDRAKKGRTVTRRGEENNKSKLTCSDIVAIRELYSNGLTGTALAKQYGVRHCAIYDIIHGNTWRHV